MATSESRAETIAIAPGVWGIRYGAGSGISFVGAIINEQGVVVPECPEDDPKFAWVVVGPQDDPESEWIYQKIQEAIKANEDRLHVKVAFRDKGVAHGV